MSRRSVLILGLGAEGGLAVLALVLGGVLGVAPLGSLGFTSSGLWWGSLGMIPLVVLLVAVEAGSWRPLVSFRDRLHALVDDLFARCTIADLLLLSALAGIGEELFFRGLMQAGLTPLVGLLPALVLTSIVFGLAHFVSWTYAVYATLVGGYLGVLFVASGTLLAPVLTHAGYDFAALLYLVTLRNQPTRKHDDGANH